MRTDILGVYFDNITLTEATERLLRILSCGDCDGAVGDEADAKPAMVFTPNPEMVMLARKDADFKALLGKADLVVPDGIGIVLASRLIRDKSKRLKQRVAGFDLVMSVLGTTAKKDVKWFFLGAAPGVAEEAKTKMQTRFEGLEVVGTHHGYFKEDENEAVVAQIAASGADVVLVGLGFPRQEYWIDRHKDDLGAKMLIGVGGSFDVMSGKVARAPKFFRKIGMEWLYRLCRQPARIWRQRVLVKFVLVVIIAKIRGVLG
jgi:N-acetylglucosaminyldiphosphoundecaprenol N-acetyl-beta-D-mannosaminyltransferase